MARADDERPGQRLATHKAGAVKLVKAVGHGTSGGHSQVTLAARAAAKTVNWPTHPDPHPHPPQRGKMPYEYQEYPKHVYPGAADPSKPYDERGKPLPYVLVRNREEEELALGGSSIVREADERRRLIAVAEVKDVKIDKRWSLDNIRAAIVGAGHDPTLNPFA